MQGSETILRDSVKVGIEHAFGKTHRMYDRENPNVNYGP